jgi:hypothetical protein
MDLVKARPKFHPMSEREVRRALIAQDPKNPIIKELARLADGYKAHFEEQCEKSAQVTEDSLRILTQCPIEAVALELAATICDEESGESAERKISPEVLMLTGYAVFGNQWQTPLAAALGINDRTVRRWAVDGAPAKIVGELREIISSRLAVGQQALALLQAIPAPA